MNNHISTHNKTRRFIQEVNSEKKNMSIIENNFRLLKHAIEFNAFDAINIRLIIYNKNYNIIDLLNYDFGDGNNFLHFLIKKYNYADYEIFTFLIKFLNVYGLLYKFFHDRNNKMFNPVNLGFKCKKYNNVYILLSFIKNKLDINKFYHSRIFFDIDSFRLISYLIKYNFKKEIIDDCKKDIYNKGIEFNSYVFPVFL